MALSQLENYIASHRKRTGLSQVEVAWILQAGDGTEVSRFEANRRLPSLQVALGFEVLFGVPVAVLFAGARVRIARQIERRIALHHRRMLVRCAGTKGRKIPTYEAKLQWHAARRANHDKNRR